MSNPINPSHYRNNGYGMETIDMMVAMFGKEKVATYCTINAFKYRMRAGNKAGNPAEQDLDKERWYIEKAAALTQQAAPEPAPIGAELPEKKRSGRKKVSIEQLPAKKQGRRKIQWTPENIEMLRSLSVGEAAAHFGFTRATVYTWRSRLGVGNAKPAKLSDGELSDGYSYEKEHDLHEQAKRLAAEHSERATKDKVGVRVDARTTVLMSPKKAEEFKRKKQENHE